MAFLGDRVDKSSELVSNAPRPQPEWIMDDETEATEATWRIERPAGEGSAFVFACPHAGRIYPASLLTRTRLRPPLLRRSEDAYADRLFAGAAGFAPVLIARFARAYVDVNRSPEDLDPAMFDGPVGTAERMGKAAVGFGVIARIIREGAEIYRRELPAAEAAFRLERVHTPYHAALAGLIAQAKNRNGLAILVDCHSMPGRHPADIVLGDRFGASAAPGLVDMFESAFIDAGFSVARNAPYAGGYATETYGRPQDGVHAIQIEVGRALYLDEERVEPGDGFEDVRTRIGLALATIATADTARVCRHRPLAAE
jgi:N-formylglutamate amidohydrolase